MTPRAHPRARSSDDRSARLVAAALRAGRAATDDAFDRFLPRELRDVSEHYWTPLCVVQRAAAWLREAQVRTVVDIGSGAGKFCVAGALLTRCRFVGLEQRAGLVASARELAETFGVDNRVTFIHGSCGVAPMPVGDAYYLFNPFGEYSFDSARFDEPGVTFTEDAYRADLAAVTDVLSRAPAGTFVITLNGIGGTFPKGYEQLDIGLGLPGTLRFWKKHAQSAIAASSSRANSSSSDTARSDTTQTATPRRTHEVT
jgi:SAM-dependent methyltransferase